MTAAYGPISTAATAASPRGSNQSLVSVRMRISNGFTERSRAMRSRNCASSSLGSIAPPSLPGIARTALPQDTGMPSDQTARAGFYGGGPILFTHKIDSWRAAGDLPGMIRVPQ